jgi:hypothetical protein
MVIEWILAPIELLDAALRVHNALKSLVPFEKHGLFGLLRRKADLGQAYQLLKLFDDRLLALRPYLDTTEHNESLRRAGRELAADTYARYRSFLRPLNMRRMRTILLNRFYAEPAVFMSIAPDLSQIVSKTREGLSVIIEDPTLLWECSCNVPREYLNSNVPCRVHQQDVNNAVTNAIRTGLVEIQYRGLKMYWKDLRSLWPPSIDSLHFAEVLDRCLPAIDMREVLDVGAGTGFLGIYLLKNRGHMRKLMLSDLFLTPLFSSLYNAYANLDRHQLRSVGLVASNGLEAFTSHKDRFDLVVCAPPYLPHLGMPELLSLDAVSGTWLLHNIITESGKLSNSLVMCYSSLAEPEFQNAVSTARNIYARLDVTYLHEVSVPFRVLHALHKLQYMDKLLSQRKECLTEGPSDSAFKYWHKIRYCMIRYWG